MEHGPPYARVVSGIASTGIGIRRAQGSYHYETDVGVITGTTTDAIVG